VSAAPGLGPREAAVLEHLAAHPGLTATELARAFGLAAEPYKQLAALQQKALVVGVPVWHPGQGRTVAHWSVAPTGSAPPPARPWIPPSYAAAVNAILRPSAPAGPAGTLPVARSCRHRRGCSRPGPARARTRTCSSGLLPSS